MTKTTKATATILVLLPTILWGSDSKKKPIDVYVETVGEAELFEPIVFGGKLMPSVSSPVLSEVTGSVVKIHRVSGNYVRQGDPILAIKPIGGGDSYRPFVVRAPVSGHILLKFKPIGSFVDKGDQLTIVGSINKFKVPFAATPQDLVNIRKIKKYNVTLSLPSSPELEATLSEISPMADPINGTHAGELEVKCPADMDCSTLPLGSIVKITALKNLRTGIKVGQRHIHSNGTQVMVLSNVGTVEFRQIKQGKNFGHEVEILEGIKPGEKLITNYTRFPSSGDKAQVISKEAQKPQKQPKSKG